ncbi:unnamed protein product [Echinostoma caproni]|uniref:RT_RNaseH domain-containing protein n=1 Tax=Echinostoma caproni TaxID=27848 RepID=A0A183BB66_9TREM|nr:unnamed protein product [Echinostoma caproni]
MHPNSVSERSSHTFPNGSAKVIAHAPRKLSAAQNYGQVEKELLTIVFTVKMLHIFLYGKRCTQPTGHKPLPSIFGSNKGIPAHPANRF